MPIQEKRVRVTLDQNPNLKVTAKTREHIGVNAVGTDEVQARLLGIPGPQGDQGNQGIPGPQGPQGEVGIIWMGEWNASAVYQVGNAVKYFGSSYVYINGTPTQGQIPTNNPAYWDVLSEKGDDGAPGATGNEHAELMKEPTGFPNLTDSRIYYDNGQHRLYIQPAIGGGSFDYWISGVKRTVSAPESVVIPQMQSMYYVYYDSDFLLKVSTTFPVPLAGIATVAILYYDVDAGAYTFFGEERHGLVMDWSTHLYLHETQGAQWANGLDLFWNDSGTGSTDDELKIGFSDGVIYDEDLRHFIRHSNTPTNFFEQILYPTGRLPIWYRDTAQGYWRKFSPNNYPLRFGASLPYYNEWTGSDWRLSDVPDGDYFVMWVYATNDVNQPVVAVMGQSTDSNLENALVANGLDKLKLGVLPSPEFKLLYRLTYLADSTFANSFKAKMVRVDDYRAFKDHYGVPSAVTPSPGPGTGGDKHFFHEQSTASSAWTVVHGLNKFPSVEVVDSGGSSVEGCVEYVDINTVRIEFSAPFTGKAFFN